MTIIELGTIGFERRKDAVPVSNVLKDLRSVSSVLPKYELWIAYMPFL